MFVVLCISFFFFFKQKTAYDMHISDWSSDVCSSDLGFRVAETEIATKRKVALADCQYLDKAQLTPCGRESFGQQHASLIESVRQQQHQRIGTQEIGRASCRERVCQYV